MIAFFLTKSVIFGVFCWLGISLLQESGVLSLQLRAIWVAALVGFSNSLMGVLLFEYAKQLRSFYMVIAMGQGLRAVVVVAITIVLMATGAVDKLDYVLGFVLFVPGFIVLEIWVYYISIMH